jgi:hypothetical protein
MAEIQAQRDFKVGVRGWCYSLEQEQIITKGEFEACSKLLNQLRHDGVLDVELFAEDESRTA